MAIPFNLPSDGETEDTYRRIDQLLLDLYDLFRQIVFRRRTVRREPTASENRVPSPDVQSASVAPVPVEPVVESRLPDVVADTLPVVRKSARRPPRRRRRRAEKPSCRFHRVHSTPYDDGQRFPQHEAPPPLPYSPSASSWLNVGIELRQIAEEITFVSRNGNSATTKKRQELKASSLFSLLVPASISGTVWTTMVILVGWRLLAKHRSAA